MNYSTKKISIVFPCLNEQEGVSFCLNSLSETLRKHGIGGEIIFVDNNSTDNTPLILRDLKDRFDGVITLSENKRGYGSALKRGFHHAKEDLVYMADCDGTYDFEDIPYFISKIHEGYDFVIGSRFAGRMDAGAMSFGRKYLGNPILSRLTRMFFDVDIADIHCGARMIKRTTYNNLALRSGGMEFATEMIIRASRQKVRMAEIPVRYRERIGKSKLNEIIDGMRHLKLMLLELHPERT